MAEQVEVTEPQAPEALEVPIEPPEAEPNGSGNRSSRARASRYKELEEQSRAAEERSRQLEERLNQQAELNAELRGQFQALERSIQGAQGDQKPEALRGIDQQIELRRGQLRLLNRELGLIQDKGQKDAFLEKHRDEALRLEEEIEDLRVDRRLAQRQSAEAPPPNESPQMQFLKLNYPEILRDRELGNAFRLEFTRRSIYKDKPLDVKSIAETVISSGRRREPPTENDRRRFAGTGQSAGGGSRSGTIRIENTKENLELARAATRGLGPMTDEEALAALARIQHAGTNS